VPYPACRREEFLADEPYDFVCVTLSPWYTPPSADPLCDEFVSTFVDAEVSR
jgi:hypothetical protein